MKRVACAGVLLAMLAAPAAAQEATPSPHGRFGTDLDCAACHRATAWVPTLERMLFDHDRQTAFHLDGSHDRAPCAACHLALRFDQPRLAGSDCGRCHVDVHQGALGSDCARCHTTESFGAARTEDVHDRTAFPLTGAHRQLICESCHRDEIGGAFGPLDTDCYGCHRDDYEAATRIDHVAQELPTDCTECHTTLAWTHDVEFDHVTASGGFDLVGAHDALACAACHVQPGYEPIWRPADVEDCVTCHLDDYEREHGAGFSTRCVDCHGVDDWEAEDFDHSAASDGFDLVGAHGRLECAACHVQPGNEPIWDASDEADCVVCHLDEHQAEHGGTGISTACADCHGVETWEGADFDHAEASGGFDLVGAHVRIECAACHVQPGNEPIWDASDESDCATCHMADYEREHAGSGFPTACAACHGIDDWKAAAFDHSVASSGFDLVGAHVRIECAACHVQPGNEPIWDASDENDCATCHRDEYDREHAGSGFPTTCLDCHGIDTWEGAQFDHGTASGGFGLIGAHTTLECAACHVVPGYQPIWNPANEDDCVACHRDEYDREHAGDGFPTACVDCHDVDSWNSNFDHDAAFFPIYSGRHGEKWSTCQTCHVNPSNFAIFTCLDCHEHRQSETDDEHGDVPGYVYESAACLRCHPNGEKD